jgi:hypothetical protein
MSGVELLPQRGRLIFNNRAIESTVNVFSSGNRFYGNGVGTIIGGGLSYNNTTRPRSQVREFRHCDPLASCGVR